MDYFLTRLMIKNRFREHAADVPEQSMISRDCTSRRCGVPIYTRRLAA
jgi:hypothetical protein